MSFTGCKFILTLSETNSVEQNPESLTSSRSYLSCLDLWVIIMFTRGSNWNISESSVPYYNFFLILFYRLLACLQNCLFPSGFQTKFVYRFLISP